MYRIDQLLCHSPRFIRNRASIFRLLLILSGDISTNPGPTKDPCTACSCNVNKNHKALQCDSCQFWSHIRCVGISKCVYEDLQGRAGSVLSVCFQCFHPLMLLMTRLMCVINQVLMTQLFLIFLIFSQLIYKE